MSILEMSYGSVKTYYHRVKEIIKPEKRIEGLYIDETKMKLNTQIFVWSAIDVDTKECLAIWVSKGRSCFETYVNKLELLTEEVGIYR